jgi:competence protein ComEA
MGCRALKKWSAFMHKEFDMQQLKSLIKVLILSSITLAPMWQVSAIADETKSLIAMEQMASVNINTASIQELSMGLTGIGIKRAERIVKYRETNGNFKSVDELMNIKGIGEKVLAKNRERITLK